MTSEELVDKFEVSLRTIRSDIKKIKYYLQENGTAEIQSIASKGNKLVIHNPVIFQQYMNDTVSFSVSQTERIRKLLLLLLSQRTAVSRQYLASKFYTSSSTVTNDLNEANRLLSEFHLNIDRSPQKGIQILGREEDKRKCLMKLGHLESNQSSQQILNRENMRQEIEKIVVSILLKHRCHISDTLFQNMIVHIEMAIQRIDAGFGLENSLVKNPKTFEEEVKIAKEIFCKLTDRFHFKVTEAEIINLAVYIKGKSDFDAHEYISEEVNSFLLNVLEEIDEKFNIDFRQEIDLRISLALHLIPLLTRIDFNIQNDNQLLDQIKQSFPLAFDIAAYMCLLLQRKIGKKVDEGEIAYLAIYFNQFISKYNDITGKQRVLIITSLKRSESILLRQRFATWFAKEISLLTLVNIHEITLIDIEEYDVVFTTEQTVKTEKIGAILINFYPSDEEYSQIKLAIDGFKDKMEILHLFDSERFYYGEIETKEEAIKKLCELSIFQVGSHVEELESSVLLREELGSSYFGNEIALPHPINPISVNTFVSVILTTRALDWDSDQNKVRLILLVAIEKNNAKVFQLWNYLAKIIQEKDLVSQLKKKPTFEYFQEKLSIILSEYI